MSQLTRSQMYDVAQWANVSIDQLMKVLLEDKATTADVYQRIYKAMDAMGLDGQVRHKIANGVVGILAPKNAPGDFINELVRAVNAALKSRGYVSVVQVRSEQWDSDLIELLQPGGIDGIISLIPADEARIVEICHQFLCPFVFHDRDEFADETVFVPYVRVDNYGAMRTILQYLLSLGHERIGYITGRLDQSAARIRFQAYRDVMAEAGIDYDERLVGEGDWEHPLAYQLAMRLLRQNPRPTAIAAANDLSAFGVIQAARELNIEIGQALSITGIDDMPLAETVSPSLTTMQQPTEALGQHAVDMLIRQMNGEDLRTTSLELGSRLIIRESTGPVRT